MRKTLLAPIAFVVVLAMAVASCGNSTSSSTTSIVSQQSSHRDSGIPKLSSLIADSYVNGLLHSENGQFMTDRFGRVVTLHGVNAVYKLDPYTLTVTPGQPNSLANPDAQRIAQLGFNVVRVGIIWAGIEPGSGGPNQPNVCTKGAAGNPGMWNQKVAQAYLKKVLAVVNELGQHHIYSLIDMHQDVWSSIFGGEGAPAWATCTNGLAIPITKGRWSNAYGEGAEIAAWDNFWSNDVVGGLQQQYNMSWALVAKTFHRNHWVVGYDPINEPSAMNDVIYTPKYEYTRALSCMYGGRSATLMEFDGKTRIACAASVPKYGVIDSIVSNDPTHLVFPEVDNATNPKNGKTLYLATTPTLSDVVYNFHDYCPYRSGQTGNPKNAAYCSEIQTAPMVNNLNSRALYATKVQPLGPAIMMTEFGATSDPKLSALIALDAGSLGLSWAWWSWRYYSDPTGSSAEALVESDNQLSPAAPALTSTYALAVAGVPIDSETNPLNGQYTLIWQSDPKINAPTSVYLDPLEFAYSYCAYMVGGTITSKPNAQILTIANGSSAQLMGLRVVPGKCL